MDLTLTVLIMTKTPLLNELREAKIAYDNLVNKNGKKAIGEAFKDFFTTNPSVKQIV